MTIVLVALPLFFSTGLASAHSITPHVPVTSTHSVTPNAPINCGWQDQSGYGWPGLEVSLWENTCVGGFQCRITSFGYSGPADIYIYSTSGALLQKVSANLSGSGDFIPTDLFSGFNGYYCQTDN